MISQNQKIRLLTLGVFVLAVLAVFLDFPQYISKIGLPVPAFFDRPFSLGLDLQGGSQLVYQADLSKVPAEDQRSAVEGVRDVIERRVNAFGVAEPLVQTTKAGDQWRIIAELAGVHDVNQAITMIGQTPLLEFKEQNPNPTVDLTEEQKQQLATFNDQAKQRAEALLAQALAPGADFAALATQNSEDQGSATNGGDLGFQARGALVPEFEKTCFDDIEVGQISPTLTQTSFGYHLIRKEAEQGEGTTYQSRCRHILIQTATEQSFAAADNAWLNTELTGTYLKRARVQFEQGSQAPEVSLEFDDEGAKLFGEITRRNIGKPVAIFLDGSPISTPTVQDAITSGSAVISGNFSIAEAKLLAQRLNAGALPVPIQLVSQQTVGATLGNESVAKSLQAGLAGLLCVALFMILYYRLPGVTAVTALLIYGALVLAIFKLIPVTLTLAGIAGFILSIGMAVDANILIFERLREELRAGKPLEVALNEGFKHARTSIIDGNVSTLITAFVLMTFSTSLIKGFAITLIIGIVVSLFSALIITKLILQLLIRVKPLTNRWLFGVRTPKVQ